MGYDIVEFEESYVIRRKFYGYRSRTGLNRHLIYIHFLLVHLYLFSFILLKPLISLFHYSLYDKSPCSKERGFSFG